MAVVWPCEGLHPRSCASGRIALALGAGEGGGGRAAWGKRMGGAGASATRPPLVPPPTRGAGAVPHAASLVLEPAPLPALTEGLRRTLHSRPYAPALAAQLRGQHAIRGAVVSVRPSHPPAPRLPPPAWLSPGRRLRPPAGGRRCGLWCEMCTRRATSPPRRRAPCSSRRTPPWRCIGPRRTPAAPPSPGGTRKLRPGTRAPAAAADGEGRGLTVGQVRTHRGAGAAAGADPGHDRAAAATVPPPTPYAHIRREGPAAHPLPRASAPSCLRRTACARRAECCWWARRARARRSWRGRVLPPAARTSR